MARRAVATVAAVVLHCRGCVAAPLSSGYARQKPAAPKLRGAGTIQAPRRRLSSSFARSACAAAVVIGTFAGFAQAQGFFRDGPEPAAAGITPPPTAEFHFARLVYSNAAGSRRGFGGRFGAWTTDYPDAEFHLSQGINRLTRVDGAAVSYSGDGGRLVRLTDDSVFQYPWLYAVEVGQWYLSDAEAIRLREYLDRGGFLMVDDFWGEYEWAVFVDSMHRVFPDRPIVELAEDHELLHVLYDLDQRTQIPGRGGQRPGTVPHWRGIFDGDGRLMVAINFNMDMGDAWEHADDPWYPEPMTTLAYRFAVNYLIYSMTH